MSRKPRVKKTLGRKLRDLDAHLYFLKESLAKLAAGDDAYLKPLAAELRVLACKASGTEGLLWRVIDDLHGNDAVHLHLAGNLDCGHPLARGLQFLFLPLHRAGHGDPRLTPEHYSLKGLIKECEAVVVSGTGYTHETLIRAVAEQIGSAHEDEGAEPYLIELSNTIMSDQAPLNEVLMFDAELVLEVGERALAAAVQETDFVRTARPAVPVAEQMRKLAMGTHGSDFEGAPHPMPPEGTVMFLVCHPDADWRMNSHRYDFGVFSQGPLSVRTTKHADRTIEVCVEGLGESIVTTRRAIPTTDQPGVMVGFTWSGREVVFYLCGQRVDAVEYGPKG